MARKDTSTVEELEATEAAVEASTEPATEASTETAEKVEPDLTAFNQAADEAIVSGDFDAVNAEYNKLDRAGKAKATSHVNAEIKRQLTEVKDKDAAFAWGQLGQALKTTKPAKEKVERVPVNRTESVVETLASLYLAYSTAKANVVTEGLDEDWHEKVNAKISEVTLEVEALVAHRNLPAPAEGTEAPAEPEVSDVARRAVRLAFQGSATKSKASGSSSSGPVYNGPRRSIPQHIAEAFASHPSGTFLSVSAIRSFVSSVYGTDLPSAGAISAALKSPKWDASEGITPGNGGDKGTFGATKA
jgi:hypothetical protein